MYMSTQTIVNVYKELSKFQYKNNSIIHIFLILKAIGVNDIEYKTIELVKDCGFEFAHELGYLFNPLEVKPSKCDFINPFNMDSWSNNPTEILSKWVSSRVKNNIIGGATTWRKLILQTDENEIKFRHDYIDSLLDLTIDKCKYNLLLLAIWVNRFTYFEKTVSVSDLINNFMKRYNLTMQEVNFLFTTQSSIVSIEFSESLHKSDVIRGLIGAPENDLGWILSHKIIGKTIDFNEHIIRRYENIMSNNPSIELLIELLDHYHQIILSGPPGTSKSYYATLLSKNYDRVVNIQFHPQYNYQQFVGGYVVKGTQVVYELGVFTNLLKEAKQNESKKFLIIIDEINRANLSQVFGEIINCLDRDNNTYVQINGEPVKFQIPKNLHIIGTMNTTDRTLGGIDFALKRRFVNVYFQSNPNLLSDLCTMTNGISLTDFLLKLNNKLFEATQNREFSIGHAFFLNNNYLDSEKKFIWDLHKLTLLFNYRILPLIEDYCHDDSELIRSVLGAKLSERLNDNEIETAIKEFLIS